MALKGSQQKNRCPFFRGLLDLEAQPLWQKKKARYGKRVESKRLDLPTLGNYGLAKNASFLQPKPKNRNMYGSKYVVLCSPQKPKRITDLKTCWANASRMDGNQQRVRTVYLPPKIALPKSDESP